MAEDLRAELRQLAREIGGVPGTLAVVLFGSYVRGEQHEGSDIDLLVLFDSEAALMLGRTKVAQVAAGSGLFLQPLCLTVKELQDSPLLLTILRDGEILYHQASFNLSAMAVKRLRPYALLTYDLRQLPPKEKVKFIHTLQGRGKGRQRYPGLLDHVAGYKVGRNTLMVPADRTGQVYQLLDQLGAPYLTRHVWTIEPEAG